MFELFVSLFVAAVMEHEKEQEQDKADRERQEELERQQKILADAARPLWERPRDEQARILSLQNLQRVLSLQRA